MPVNGRNAIKLRAKISPHPKRVVHYPVKYKFLKIAPAEAQQRRNKGTWTKNVLSFNMPKSSTAQAGVIRIIFH